MLSLTLVRLQTGKAEPRSCLDLLSDFNRRFTRGDAASAGTDVDLDQALDGRAVFLCTSLEIVHIIQVVHTDDHAGARRQGGEALDLLGGDHLVRDEDVPDASAHQRFGLAHLLAADTASPALLDLVDRDIGRLMCLGVRPVPQPVILYELGQLRDVTLESIEVHKEAGRIDVFERHADAGGNIDGHVTFRLSDYQEMAFANWGGMSRSSLPPVRQCHGNASAACFVRSRDKADRKAPSVSEDRELLGEGRGG